MRRILDPAQIEAFAERAIARVRLCDPDTVFSARAGRLRALARQHALADYLALMAVVADAQQVALQGLRSAGASLVRMRIQGELARTHHMPVLPASGSQCDERWRTALHEICGSVASAPGFPPAVRQVCERIVAADHSWTQAQADGLLSGRLAGMDAPAAPFIMAALQVYWVAMAATLEAGAVAPLEVAGVCPVCGTLPVASIVYSDKRSAGYRYLHCALCATEWHMVRIVCSHCQSTEGITYNSIEGGNPAIRAESCRQCGTYRKIFYQEKDPEVEAVADDLASLALDLLMTEEGYHRSSGNPLLWQNAPA